MAFDIGLKFSVETAELLNARNALQSLAQAAKDLNNNQDKAAGAADKLAESNDKVATAAGKAADALEKAASATPALTKSAETAESKLSRLQDQLSFMRDDLNLTEVGFTKSQSGVLAWAKSVGATVDTLKEYTKVFDDMNKIMGTNPFDQSAKGLAMLNNEMLELERSSQLVKDGITLTSQQTKMLTRDLEALRQQNETLGKSALEGAADYERAFIEKAAAVNNLRAIAAEAEKEEKERARQAAALAKEHEELERRKTEATQREEANRLAIIENARKSVNDKLMNEWAGGVGQKSPELNKMASQYAEDEAASIKRQADAYKIAADAVAYLDREQVKLTMTNDLLSRGFTIASANALFRYKEAMEAAGQSAMQVKQNLYLLEQDLIKRQNTSPFAKMREDMQEMQKQTNHLARAISTQLGDVFVSLASGQNPLTVMIQQGDQIRGAVEQAKAAGQDMSKVMQGAFASMANSFKLVGGVLKEFVVDGVSSVSNAMLTMVRQSSEISKIRADLEAGLISPLRASRLEFVALADASKVMLTATTATVGTFALVAAKAYYDVTQETYALNKALTLQGASLGLSVGAATELAGSMRNLGVSTSQGKEIIMEMAKLGGFTTSQFAEISAAAVAMSDATGVSLQEVIKSFSAVNKDPVKALSDLQIAQGNVSEEIMKTVANMVEQGDKSGASALAMSEYARATKEVADELIAAMPWYKELWMWLDKGMQAAWDFTKALFSFGAAANVATELKEVNEALSAYSKTGEKPWYFALTPDDDYYSGLLNKQKDLMSKLDAENKKYQERQQRSQQESGQKAAEKAFEDAKRILDKNEDKQMSRQAFVNKEVEKYVKLLGDAKASSEQLATYTEAMGAKWDKMQKKAPSGSKPKETYKVDRSNELAETKKFYDEQLKQLKDAESKQEAILKQSYDAKMISFGEYYAKQTELTLTSQREQLAVINESSDKQKAAIQSRMLEHIAAFEKEVRAGGNVVELTNKLDAELANLTRTYGGVTQATDTQTQALQSATDKKFYEFYKELNKNLNESTSAFEKFSDTVANNAANRQADLDLQRQLLNTYGAEAEALKANANVMRSYSSEIKKQSDLLAKQDKLIEDMRKGRDSLTDDAARAKVDADITKRLEERAEIEKNLNNTTALAKQDAEQAAIDAVAAYNLKVFQEIRDSLSDALYDAIFEGGSKGADALKNILENAFKNYVINVLINPVVGNVVGSVMNAIGMGQGLPGVAGGGGGFNLGGGSLDIGQSLIDYGYKVAGSSEFLGNAISDLGTGIKGLETSIKGIPGLEGGYGSLLGYGSSILSLSEGKYGSAIGTGIGTSLMPTLGPLAPMVGSMLGSLLDDTLGDLFSGGPPNLGSAYTYNTKTGASKEYGGPEDIGEEADKVTAQLMESTVAGINDLFKKLGSAAKVEDFWGGFAAREDGGDSAWAGGTLSNGVKFGQQWSKDIETELGSVEEAMKQYQAELSKATLDALKQATDVPEYIQNKLKDIDIQNLTSDGVTKLVEEIGNLHAAVSGVNSSFDLMGVSLDTVSTKSGEYQTSLVESSGGMEAFTNNMASYYENFYSESERSAKAMESLTQTFTDAGIEMPATREEYRKLVEAAVAGGDATKGQLATLLKLSDAFATLVPATNAATSATGGFAKMLKSLGVDMKVASVNFDKSTTAMFESLGISVDEYSKSIASVLQGIMLGTIPAEEAGVQLANAAVGGITSAIAAGASQMIAAEFTNAIIAPVVANIMAGKAALDGIDMATTAANITAQASAVATALAALGPTLSDALNGIISSVANVASSAGSGSFGSSSSEGRSNFSSGPDNRPQPQRELPSINEWVESNYSLAKGVTEANAKTTELLNELLKSKEAPKTPWEEIAVKRKQFSEDLQSFKDARDNAYTELQKILNEGFISKFDFEQSMKDSYLSQEELDRQYLYYLEHARGKMIEQQKAFDWNTEAIKELESKSKEWILSQTRLLATEEYVTLAKETQAAIDKTAELKLTGGLEDPVTKLKQQFAEKMKNFNDNIKKVLMDEVDALKEQKPDDKVMRALQQNIGYKKTSLDAVSGENLTQSISSTEKLIQGQKDAIEEIIKNMYTVEGMNDLALLPGLEDQLRNTQQYLEKLKSGEATADAQKAYEEAQQAMLDALLAATDPAKQQELLDEIAKYEDGITGWFKAQAGLLSTEMLIDINNQIKDLEAEEKGPLTTIKEAIQKYVDDFTELGTLTKEVQAALDKLSDLQLTKAREELYNQLLSEDELKLVQQTKLSKEFQDLGVTLPDSADALRSMIDAARAAGNITLADSLLELVPAFMALQGAAEGVGKGVDEANKAFDVFKRAVESQIKELEKTFTATDLAMKVLEKAVESEKKRLTEQLNTAKESVKTLQKIFDTLDKGIKDLRNEVDQTKQMQADEARRVIDVANLTGVLPDADRLSEAVSALTTSVKDGLYATAYDKSRAFLTLANDLETLKNTTEPQLTSAEQTVVNLEKQIEQLDDLLEQARKQIDELRGIDASLYGIDEGITLVDAALQQLQTAAQAEEQARIQIDALNQQLEMYQKQLDVLNGIDTSVKSVEDAIRDLQAAIANAGGGNNGSGGGSNPGTGGGGGTQSEAEKLVSSAYSSIGRTGFGSEINQVDRAGFDYWVKYVETNGSSGFSEVFMKSILDFLKNNPNDAYSKYIGKYLNLPGFAVGTNYVPKDMIANIHKGEMIIPKRFNPATSGLQQDNSELVDELKALRAEVAMLRAEARATAVNTSKTARILDDVTQGGDTLKTEVAA